MSLPEKYEMIVPEDYTVQNGCHNCAECFVYYEYDSGPEYFCTFFPPTRPPCGSVAMGDNFPDDEGRNSWWSWSEKRSVKPAGICPNHSLASNREI